MARIESERCRLPAAFWNAVERLGLRPASVLRQAGLSPNLHLADPSFISVAQLFAVWNALERLSGDPGFGIRMACTTETTQHKMAFIAASYAANFRDGLERIARFKRLCSPDRLRFDESGGSVTVSSAWPAGSAPEPSLSIEANFALLLELGRRGTGRHLKPLAVELRRPDPNTGQQEAYFACPIRYARGQDRLVLRRADLDLPFAGHNHEFLAKLTPTLVQEMSDLQTPTSVSGQVKITLMEIMSAGSPNIRDVAAAIGLSTRTLQRRITIENATFRDLLTEVRRSYGRQLLSDPKADVAEIAFLLGYEDTNSFYRAFRTWEGMTPSEWRQDYAARSQGVSLAKSASARR